MANQPVDEVQNDPITLRAALLHACLLLTGENFDEATDLLEKLYDQAGEFLESHG